MASKKFDIDYYNDMFDLSHNKLNFQTVQPNTISNLPKSCNFNKAARIDIVSGRLLKDDGDVLGIPLHRSVTYRSNYLTFRKTVK